MSDNKNERVSYSELKIWNECAFKHKLMYVDGIKNFNGNEHTAFGTTMHYLCEKIMVEEDTDFEKVFSKKFEEEFDKLDSRDPKLESEMKSQGPTIMPQILPAVDEYFTDYEVHTIEEQLFEDMLLDETSEIKYFKGFIDLVLKTPDGNFHIIDWKTTSWGWNFRKKNDKILAYQLVLYKNFFAKKHDIPLEKIHTYFALLKRTPTANNVEIFKVSSGPKRLTDGLTLLKNAIFNITSKNYIKNKLSCSRCEFYKTPHCP